MIRHMPIFVCGFRHDQTYKQRIKTRRKILMLLVFVLERLHKILLLSPSYKVIYHMTSRLGVK